MYSFVDGPLIKDKRFYSLTEINTIFLVNTTICLTDSHLTVFEVAVCTAVFWNTIGQWLCNEPMESQDISATGERASGSCSPSDSLSPYLLIKNISGVWYASVLISQVF